jgi:hypothetical protein
MNWIDGRSTRNAKRSPESTLEMHCAICKSLRREHAEECAIEARNILDQEIGEPSLREVILASRKRQLKIVAEIERHREEAHSFGALPEISARYFRIRSKGDWK